ncbi:ubiquitin carboxyl-terminal hydrolase 47-like [Megalobrama amblycephala]|uniref:ubiquitin carboxyl-terminal hydrolase 47-like n=1 Tax=Megalobrama amblycephala TaxID=75352 RepID=UPI0020145A2B|nr:ubiquitin carboxyl-terminal hydrolase 47-like [Megalobrama amblycephala]
MNTQISGHCGLENQGSCCLNAVLQTLFMTKEFREHVESVSSDDDFIKELKKLFNELETQKNAVSAAGITESLGITDVHKEQDAAELLHLILDQTPGSSEIFKGTIKTTITWRSCGHKQESLEAFLSLTVSFKDSQDVEDAVEAHIDQMCGEYPLNCFHCNSTVCKKASIFSIR